MTPLNSQNKKINHIPMFIAKKKTGPQRGPHFFMAIADKVIVFCFLLFLCSCAPKQQITISNATTYFDAPIPLGFRCIEKRTTSDGNNSLLIARYQGTQSLKSIVTFYRREMEAAGWDLSNFSSDQEGLFACRKGKKECAISIRIKGKTTITFFYKNNDERNSCLF